MIRKPDITELRAYINKTLRKEDIHNVENAIKNDEETKKLYKELLDEHEEIKAMSSYEISGEDARLLYKRLRTGFEEREPENGMLYRLSENDIAVLLLSGKRLYLGKEYVKIVPLTSYTEFAAARDREFQLPGLSTEQYTTHIHLITIIPVASLERFIGKLSGDILSSIKDAEDYRAQNLLYEKEAVQEIDETLREDFIVWTAKMKKELQIHRNKLELPSAGNISEVREESKVVYTIKPLRKPDETVSEPEAAYGNLNRHLEFITGEEPVNDQKQNYLLGETESILVSLSRAENSLLLNIIFKDEPEGMVRVRIMDKDDTVHFNSERTIVSGGKVSFSLPDNTLNLKGFHITIEKWNDE